jgi:hypothetical protein
MPERTTYQNFTKINFTKNFFLKRNDFKNWELFAKMEIRTKFRPFESSRQDNASTLQTSFYTMNDQRKFGHFCTNIWQHFVLEKN